MLEYKYKLKTKYSGEIDIAVHRQEYSEGGVAITLMCNLDGYPEPWTTLTLWHKDLQPGEVAIKNYSENEGMLQWAIDNKLVFPPHRYVQGEGYITSFPVCKLTIVEALI